MSSRAVKVCLSGLFILAAMLLAILLFLRSESGSRFVFARALPTLERLCENRLNSQIKIDNFSGALLDKVSVQRIALSQEGKEWLIIENLQIDLSVPALLSKSVKGKTIWADKISLLYLPSLPPKKEKTEQPFTLPTNFPKIAVEKIGTPSLYIGEGLFGEERTYAALIRMTMGGRDVHLHATIKDNREADFISLVLEKDGRSAELNADIRSADRGILSKWAKTTGAMAITAQAKGPIDKMQGTLKASLPGLVKSDAQISLNLAKDPTLALAGTVTLSPTRAGVAATILGDDAVIETEISRHRRAWTITLNKLVGRFGQAAGDAQLSSRKTIGDMDAQLSIDIDEAYARSLNLPELAGEHALFLTTQSKRRGTGFDFTWTSDVGSVSLTDGLFTQKGLVGEFNALLPGVPRLPGQFTELSSMPVSASGLMTYADGALQLTEGTLALGEEDNRTVALKEIVFSYDRKEQALSGNGDILLARLSPFHGPGWISLSGPIQGSLTVSGALKNLLLETRLNYPATTIRNNSVAGGLATIKARFHDEITGKVTLKANRNKYQLSSGFSLTKKGFSVPDFKLLFQEAVLTAEMTAIKKNKTTLKAHFATSGPTRLSDEQSIDGLFDLTASFNPRAPQRDLTANFKTDRFSLNDRTVKGLTIEISTSTDPVINLAASFSRLTSADTSFNDTRLVGNLQPGAGIHAVLTKFDGILVKGRIETPVSLLTPLSISHEQGTLTIAQTTVGFGDNGKATLSLRKSPAVLQASLQTAALKFPDFPIYADINAALDTTAATPAEGTVHIVSKAFADTQAELKGQMHWNGKAVTLKAQIDGLSDKKPGTLSLTWPLVLADTERLKITMPVMPVNGSLQLNNDIQQIYAFLPLVDDYVKGALSSTVTLSGTSHSPEINGRIELDNGYYEGSTNGITVQNIHGVTDLAYAGGRSQGRFSLTGADLEGKSDAVILAGAIDMGSEAEKPQILIDGTLSLNKALLINAPEFILRSSADLALKGPLNNLTLSGDIGLQSIDALIPDIPEKNSYTPVKVIFTDETMDDTPRKKSEKSRLHFDLAIKGDRRLFLRGRGLESEWKTVLTLTGSARQPILKGTAEVIDGYMNFAGRRLDINSGIIRFANENLIPQLAVEANQTLTTADGTIEVGLVIKGQADNPAITFESTPELPQEDVMSYLLFGKEPSQLSAIESLRIAAALAEVSGASPFGNGLGVTNFLRRGIGVDRLSFGSDEETGLNEVTVGKYVTDEVYVSATQDTEGTGGSVTLTYEVNDHINIETTVEQTGTQSVSANFKRDY